MFNYRRWRHTRGFGVHSPYAYDLVKYVIRPEKGYLFYGYEDIKSAVRGEHCGSRVEREAKMLHRLMVALRPDSIFLPHGISAAYQAAVSSSDSRILIERRPRHASGCRMIASHHDFISLDVLRSHIAVDGNILAVRNIPEGWMQALFESLPAGLMFYSPRNVIIINRPHMRKIGYSMFI